MRLAENGGAGGGGTRACARRGQFIAYLDADDEYYAGDLEQVAAARDKGDVFLFPYDMAYEDGPPGDRAEDWDRRPPPNPFRLQPRGSAGCGPSSQCVGQGGRVQRVESHGRRTGILWKRMARVGAKFAYLPGKSGVYQVCLWKSR